MTYEQAVKEGQTNNLCEWRWQFCRHFILGRETKHHFEPNYCPYRTNKYGCIACTKFATT